MRSTDIAAIAAIATTSLLLSTPAWAAWPRDASIPLPVFDTAPVQQISSHTSPSPNQGLLVVALDSLAGGSAYRVQRFDSEGTRLWGPGGVTVASVGAPWSTVGATPLIATDAAG